MKLRESIVKEEGIGDCDCFRTMFIDGERNLVGEIGVKASSSFRSNEAITYWSHFVAPLEPVLVKFSFASAQGGFFGHKGSVSVDIS